MKYEGTADTYLKEMSGMIDGIEVPRNKKKFISFTIEQSDKAKDYNIGEKTLRDLERSYEESKLLYLDNAKYFDSTQEVAAVSLKEMNIVGRLLRTGTEFSEFKKEVGKYFDKISPSFYNAVRDSDLSNAGQMQVIVAAQLNNVIRENSKYFEIKFKEKFRADIPNGSRNISEGVFYGKALPVDGPFIVADDSIERGYRVFRYERVKNSP